MKPKTFFYFLHEAFLGIFRNSLMSLAAIGIVSIALFLFGFFYLFSVNIQHLGALAWDKIEVRVFLKQDVSNQSEIKEKLTRIPGVKNVKFIPKKDGAAALERLLGNKNLFTNDDNPLPDCFHLSPTEKADIEEITRLASAIPGVEEIVYGQNFVRFIKVLIRLVLVAGFVMMIIMALAVLYMIINTIQLTVYARRTEIEIMKLVGATNSFVRWPFLLEGIFLGIAGALLAVLLLTKGYGFLLGKLGKLDVYIPLLRCTEVKQPLIISLFAMGIFFGGTGSLFSLQRYLKV